MINPTHALAAIPAGLRTPLLDEYKEIVQNYFEHRWAPSELSGGKFSEIVYTILDGHAKNAYPSVPSKPASFVNACKALENNAHVPRSFQILIPRLLPALYEIRNNRGVGHVGGDVDPNHMDATAVLTNANWITAELVRVYHNLATVQEAQAVVDSLVEQRVPLVWQVGAVKRVLNPALGLKDQCLLLLASVTGAVPVDDLREWLEATDSKYFMRSIRAMHSARLVELDEATRTIQILPPGSNYISKALASGFRPTKKKPRTRRR